MKCCDKTLFSGSSTAEQTVAAGAAISFTKNYSVNVSDVTVNSITLHEAGVYLVVVDASGAPTAAGDVSIQLQINGTPVTAYTSTATSTGATDFVHVGFSAIVRVDPTVCCYVDRSETISVINLEAEATYTNASISVVRL